MRWKTGFIHGWRRIVSTVEYEIKIVLGDKWLLFFISLPFILLIATKLFIVTQGALSVYIDGDSDFARYLRQIPDFTCVQLQDSFLGLQNEKIEAIIHIPSDVVTSRQIYVEMKIENPALSMRLTQLITEAFSTYYGTESVPLEEITIRGLDDASSQFLFFLQILILLLGFSLPLRRLSTDRESKMIDSLLSSPLHRSEYIIGKALFCTMLISFLTGIMVLCTTLFIVPLVNLSLIILVAILLGACLISISLIISALVRDPRSVQIYSSLIFLPLIIAFIIYDQGSISAPWLVYIIPNICAQHGFHQLLSGTVAIYPNILSLVLSTVGFLCVASFIMSRRELR